MRDLFVFLKLEVGPCAAIGRGQGAEHKVRALIELRIDPALFDPALFNIERGAKDHPGPGS